MTSVWDSTPIGQSIDLYLCKLSPQLILEDKVFHLHNNLIYNSLQFIGTFISDDESKRLTYVIDRLIERNDIKNHQLLTGEFFIPIQYDKKNNFIQNGIKEINMYCHSSLPIELHRFSYICGQLSPCHSSSVNVDLSFDLLTIKNSFILTPINPHSIQIIPTALLKNLNSFTENNIYLTQPHFGYCCLDRITQNKIFLLLENDPQACTLPLIGIWISGIIDIQCTFVWSVCLRYCLNSSLKHRLRSGINSQQSFLLLCYLPTSSNQCSIYEVYSTSSMTIEYDLWTCSKQILISSYQYNTFPYDFQFQRVSNEDNYHQIIQSSPNKNGSLFGIPRSPPKQSLHQTPSWELISIPKRMITSPSPLTILPTDNRWKEEFVERMQSYEQHIQALTTLVTQLLTTQQESTKRDVAVQSEPSSPCVNDRSSSNRHSSQSPIITTNDRPLSPPIIHEEETIIDYSSTDLNRVDILKPIFKFIDNQQQKQQQGSITSLMTTNNNNNNEENDSQNENMFHLANVTSTRTTGISLISNGVQMQFINQESSTTTVYPQSQSAPSVPPPQTELVLTSPQKSENNLSIEVHGLEMKYLEDDQLAVAIECDRQSQTPQVIDKSLSFGTQEYLKRYGLFNNSNSS